MSELELEPERETGLTVQERQQVRSVAQVASTKGKLGVLPAALFGEAPLDDLWGTARNLHEQINLFEGEEKLYPAVQLQGAEIPLDVWSAVPSTAPFTKSDIPPHLAEQIKKRAIMATEDTKLYVAVMPSSTIRRGFSGLLADAIEWRIKAARGFFGNRNTARHAHPVPGLNIIVNTVTPGIRVLVTPALLFTANVAFGNSLSTPVSGYLNPGKYIFGGTGSAIGGTRWENVVESIPPTSVVNTVLI